MCRQRNAERIQEEKTNDGRQEEGRRQTTDHPFPHRMEDQQQNKKKQYKDGIDCSHTHTLGILGGTGEGEDWLVTVREFLLSKLTEDGEEKKNPTGSDEERRRNSERGIGSKTIGKHGQGVAVESISWELIGKQTRETAKGKTQNHQKGPTRAGLHKEGVATKPKWRTIKVKSKQLKLPYFQFG